MKLDRFEEQVFFAINRIVMSSDKDPSSSIGTGFIVRVITNVDKNECCMLLFSNKHVFGDTQKNISILFHKAQEDGTPDLTNTITLTQKDFDQTYYPHPNPDIDLACINISFMYNNPSFKIFSKSIEQSMLANYEEKELLPGKDVWFIGYPENRYDSVHNLPILRKGFIGSIPTLDFDGKREIIIDAPVFPGSSGSPVFTTLDGMYKLIGVLSKAYAKNEPVKPISKKTNKGVTQFISLGVVIKVGLINELIDEILKKF